LHLTLAILGPGFLALGYWQLRRALSGNDLSWAYTVEWPVFTVYAVFMWWRLLHEPFTSSAKSVATDATTASPRRHGRSARAARETAQAAREAAELASYNAYLATLDPSVAPSPREDQPT
jgi:hypothetical protein